MNINAVFGERLRQARAMNGYSLRAIIRGAWRYRVI